MSAHASTAPLPSSVGPMSPSPPPAASAPRAQAAAAQAEVDSFIPYQKELIHSWVKTTAMLGFTLVPLFVILDYFTMPPEKLRTFAWYRGITTVAVLIQYLVIRRTRPSRWSYLHGYVFSVMVGGMIVQMTVDLGGFDSAYYAGLNLVIVAVNLLLPWRAVHSAVNGLIVLGMYVVYNVVFHAVLGTDFKSQSLVNNLYFMGATVVICVAINYTKARLIEQEYRLREKLDRSGKDLKAARDALWGEMEVAKRIQTALLPRNHRVGPYQVAAVMQPAAEVGGDYYDIIETDAGERWVNIGDVSGHGVESGLVMMMTQTSILSAVTQQPGMKPSEVFRSANAVLRENISRLKTNRYMTLNIIRLEENRMVLAGKHQDILVWRNATRRVETVVNDGCWIGMVKDTAGVVDDLPVDLASGDMVLLFTDGITEATGENSHDMYGQERLAAAFERVAQFPPEDALQELLRDVKRFAPVQEDDITLLIIRRT